MKTLRLPFLHLLTLLLYSINGNSQVNLVPNGSFETLSSCPDNTGQLSKVQGWFPASRLSATLFNSCATQYQWSIPPINPLVPSPKDGNGYVSIWSFIQDGPKDRMLIETMLRQPLSPGKQYYVSFYTMLFKGSGCGGYLRDFAIDASGAALTRDMLVLADTQHIKASIEHRGSLLNDTVNWQHICGTMIGAGERYITIGNFQPDTALVFGDTTGYFYCLPNISEYFVDQVEVYEYDPLPDTLLLCRGGSVRLGSRFLDQATYTWSTGSIDSVISVSAPGMYSVTAYVDCCGIADTVIVVDGDAAAYQLPHDTVACLPVILSVGLPGNYQWSDGSRSSEIEVDATGDYSLTISNECAVVHTDFAVSGRQCQCDVFVPNAFSPNGDGINDILQIFSTCDYPLHMLRCLIADRWGEILYSSTGSDVTTISWDGNYKGKPLDPGLYIILVDYEYMKGEKPEPVSIKQSLTLIR